MTNGITIEEYVQQRIDECMRRGWTDDANTLIELKRKVESAATDDEKLALILRKV